jgi:hypothetical protein
MMLVTFCDVDLISFPEGSLGIWKFVKVAYPLVRSEPMGGFEITVVFTSGDVAPIRAKLSPSARALKFLGGGAET